MSRQKEESLAEVGINDEENARLRVEAYLAPVYADPLNDDRKLSIRGVAKAIKMSVNTLYKYRLEDRVAEAEEHRKMKRVEAGVERGSAATKALSRAHAEREKWRERYENLLERYINLQHGLRLEPSVNIERVLERTLPKAVRDAPGNGRRGGRRRRVGLP